MRILTTNIPEGFIYLFITYLIIFPIHGKNKSTLVFFKMKRFSSN